MRLALLPLLMAVLPALSVFAAIGALEGGRSEKGARDDATIAQVWRLPAARGSAERERIRQIISPRIEGDTLVIEGRIDSHIYDYLAYEAARIAAVNTIELNSLGGSAEWALAIAHKVRDLGKTTLLRSGHVCASACAFIFAAGREREASEDTWIGIHGARLGPGYLTEFEGVCFVDREEGSVFEPHKKGCQDFLQRWREATMASTSEAFGIMESSGVSPALRRAYFAMPDDPDWPAEMNAIGKPDWPLRAQDALRYNLVTKLLPLGK